MNKRVVATWNVENMDQMMVALHEALSDALASGHHSSTVFPNKLRTDLVEETLSDGSTVMNLRFHDGARNLADAFSTLGKYVPAKDFV